MRETAENGSATSTTRYCTVWGSYNTNVHRGHFAATIDRSSLSLSAIARRPAQQCLQPIRSFFFFLLHWPTRILAPSLHPKRNTIRRVPFRKTTIPIARATWIAINTEGRSISSRGWDGPRDWSDTGYNSKRGDSFQGSCVTRLRLVSRVLGMCSTISFAHCAKLPHYKVKKLVYTLEYDSYT